MKVGEVYAVLGLDFSQYNKDEAQAKNRVEGLGATLSGVFKNAFSFTIGMSLFQAMRKGFQATVSTAVDFNDTLQQAHLGFTTLLGSARKADTYIKDMAVFAAKTPFKFVDLIMGAKRMMALGFAAKNVLPTLKTVGDAASALGTGQEGINAITTGLGQIQTAGRVTSRAMMVLSQAGVPSWQILADAIGKSLGETRDLIQKGAIDAEVGLTALISGMEGRFGGMMERMEGTWRGVTSAIKDIWQLVLGAVTKNLFTRTTQWLKRVKDTMLGFYEAFTQGGLMYAIEKTFGPDAAYHIAYLINALKGLWGSVVGVGRTIIQYWSTIGPVVIFGVKAFLAFKTAALLAAGASYIFTRATALWTTVVGVVKGLAGLMGYYRLQIHLASAAWMSGGPIAVTWLTRIQAAVHSLNVALGTTLWPLMVIGGLLMGGVSLWTKYTQAVQKAADQAMMAKMAAQQQEYKDSMDAFAKGTGEGTDALGELGKAANKNIQSFDEIHQLTEDSVPAFGDLIPPITPIIPDSLNFDMDFSFDMEAALAEAKANMGGFWGWLKEGFINFGGWLKGVWGNIWGVISYVGSGAFEVLRVVVLGFFQFFVGLFEVGALVLQGIWWVLVQVWTAVWGAISYIGVGVFEVLRAVISAFLQFFVGLFDAGVLVLKGIWWGLVQVWTVLWAALTHIVSDAWDVITFVATAAWHVMVDLWNALVGVCNKVWGLIKAGWQAYADWAARLWVKVQAAWQVYADWAARLWDGVKVAWSIFVGWAVGIWDGVKSAWDIFITWVLDAWGKMIAGFAKVKAELYDHLVEPFNKAKDWIEGIIKKALDWGKNFIGNLVDGIKSGIAWVVKVGGAAATALFKFLGFSSPTEEGPGRYADQWAPNLMKMYSKGILSNLNLVQSAASAVAGSLMPMATVTPSTVLGGFEGRGGNSLVDEISSVLSRSRGLSSPAGTPLEIPLIVNGRELGRALIPEISMEQVRAGREFQTITRTT